MDKMKFFEKEKIQEEKNFVNNNLMKEKNLMLDDDPNLDTSIITKDLIFGLVLSEKRTCEAFLKIVKKFERNGNLRYC